MFYGERALRALVLLFMDEYGFWRFNREKLKYYAWLDRMIAEGKWEKVMNAYE